MNYIRKTTVEDVVYVADNMRTEDVEECKANGFSPFDALWKGYNADGVCYTMVDPEGKPAGLLGVSLLATSGLIWLLGTPSIEQYGITFLRQCKPFLERLFEEANRDLLWNYTYKLNTLHHKWLKWLGFSFVREVGDFYEFAKLKKG